MHVWNARGCWNTGRKTSPQIRHLRTIAQLCRAISSQLSNVSTIGKKNIKQQYLLHTFSQYGELRHISDWDRLASLWHPSKFQRVSRLGFVTAPTSLNGGQLHFSRCLTVSWAGRPTLYIFPGSCPLTESCLVQNSLCVQILRSPVLEALLHGTGAAVVSQTLRRGTGDGITKLSLLAILNRGRHLYSEGGHHVGHRPTF